MADFVISEDAGLDLQNIYRVGLDQFGQALADQYLDELYHLFDLFAHNPLMGSDIVSGGRILQRYPHKSHIILFEAVDGGTTIRRVFYGGSDYLDSL